MSAMEPTKKECITSVCQSRAPLFCSVCLDAVVEGEDRSIARLKCGHHFHLDCIGSAFNVKGRMQCPNCRQEEHGRWLYANTCCLHEDFLEVLTSEVDAEEYNAAAEMVRHAPWCPHHQISYGHFSLAFEEPENSAISYLRPLLRNAVHHVQVPGISGGQMGQYLAGMRLGRPLNHVEDIMALQMNHVGHAWNHSGRTNVTNGLQSGSMLVAFDRAWASYGGSTHNGLFGNPNFRHPSLGFLMGSPRLVQAGYRNNIGFFRRGQMHTRQRHGDAFQNAERMRPMSPSARGQRSEPIHGNGSFYPSVQRPSQAYHGNRMSWAIERSQVEASYAYGVPAQWWAWVPTETRSAAQNMTLNMHPYYEGLLSSTLRPMPLAEGPLEHIPEGPYAWVLY